MENDLLPAPRGRPIRPYDPLLASEVCEARAMSDHGLCKTLAARPDLPSWSTVTRWMREVPAFDEAMTRARDLWLERKADGLCDLAGEARAASTSHEVQAIKLAVDTRKWMLSKLMAPVYGDRLDVTSKGGALPAPSHQVDARVQSIVMQAAMRMAAKSGDLVLPPSAADLLD
ncbi:hypothetical protein [Parafrankia sp. BMG5.11]|uniref:terminase small subunit-like protein n=1 Tax=Parafrankia sp. BMG5.11 TaxID=222540 RepID=UPI00359F8DD4